MSKSSKRYKSRKNQNRQNNKTNSQIRNDKKSVDQKNPTKTRQQQKKGMNHAKGNHKKLTRLEKILIPFVAFLAVVLVVVVVILTNVVNQANRPLTPDDFFVYGEVSDSKSSSVEQDGTPNGLIDQQDSEEQSYENNNDGNNQEIVYDEDGSIQDNSRVESLSGLYQHNVELNDKDSGVSLGYESPYVTTEEGTSKYAYSDNKDMLLLFDLKVVQEAKNMNAEQLLNACQEQIFTSLDNHLIVDDSVEKINIDSSSIYMNTNVGIQYKYKGTVSTNKGSSINYTIIGRLSGIMFSWIGVFDNTTDHSKQIDSLDEIASSIASTYYETVKNKEN